MTDEQLSKAEQLIAQLDTVAEKFDGAALDAIEAAQAALPRMIQLTKYSPNPDDGTTGTPVVIDAGKVTGVERCPPIKSGTEPYTHIVVSGVSHPYMVSETTEHVIKMLESHHITIFKGR